MHALGAKSRANELSVINKATDIVQEKIYNLLNHTKCKSYVKNEKENDLATVSSKVSSTLCR